jgi:succinyl-CoA synthetase beta subunit
LKLQEYQSKRIFAQFGVPIPSGEVASSPSEAREIAARLGERVVIKAQVLVGGRGKAGGIKLAETPAQAEAVASHILGMEIKGLPVRKVLVDQAASIRDELYLGLVIDRARQRLVMMGSSEGGVDIEEVAAKSPEKIIKIAIEPAIGLRDYQARELALGMGIVRELTSPFVRIARGLHEAFVHSDASLAEINPLVVTGGGMDGYGNPPLLALDGKMILDDNGLYRHPELAKMRDVDEEAPEERQARENGLSYVKLDGNIGCMVNGAGLAMATMDITKLYGGTPANFLDIGGGAQADKVAAALRIILSDPNVKAVLFNIFGGITRCDEVAKGILEALKQVGTGVSMVARLVGTNEEEGRAILASARMTTATTLAEAAQLAVAAAKAA